MSLERLIEGLADADIAFVVVGMVAGQLYGSRVATYDLDVVYDTSEDNVSRLSEYLLGLDPYVKETWPNEGVASDFTRAVLLRERSLTVGTAEGEIDLLDRIDGIGDYASALSQSASFRLDSGKQVRVLTLTALIAAKRASDREKDRLHIIELETIAALECNRKPEG